MKNNPTLFLVFILMLSVISCKKEEEPLEQEKIHEILPDEKLVSDKEVNDPIQLLKNLEGKYPRQEKLFDNKQVADRLQNLEGLDYEVFYQFWNTETPVEIEEGILHSSGCKQHDCPSANFELYWDLNNDVINVYHFRNNTLRIYQDKSRIELPQRLANELELKKDNAQIGM